MANIYWLQEGADAKWDTVTGNWWTSASAGVSFPADKAQAAAIPQAGDDVYAYGTVPPDFNFPPTAGVELNTLDTTNMTGANTWRVELSGTSGREITIAEGGTLKLGLVGARHEWGGTTGTTGTFEFYGNGVNDYTGGNNATVGNGAVFNDTSTSVSLAASAVGDNAIFNDSTVIASNVGANATFNDNADIQSGTIGINAIFNDAAGLTDGTLGTGATFNDTAYISGGTVGANATLSGGGIYGGTIENNALIDCALVAESDGNVGTWSGTSYRVSGNPVWGDGALFTGASLAFVLQNSTASVTGQFTTDGGTTPKPVGITVLPDPRIITV